MTYIADFTSIESDRLLSGLLLALLIHLVVIVMLMPGLEVPDASPPVRIAVQLSQLVEKMEVEPVKPAPQKAVEATKPLLIAKDDTVQPDDLVVPVPVDEIKEKVIKPQVMQEIEPLKTKPDKIVKEKAEPKIKPERKKAVPKKEIIKQVTEVPAPVIAKTLPENKSPLTSDNEANNSPEMAQAESGQIGQTNTMAVLNRESAMSNTVDSNTAWNNYGQLLYGMVSRNKEYPQLAIRRHLEGVVMVSVRFERGELAEIAVVKPGSGHVVLDEAARKMLVKAVKQLPVQGGLTGKSFTVVVPVNFNLVG